VVTSIIGIIGPQLIDYIIKPKISLSIKDIKISEKEINGVKGYVVEARIVNRGKKIIFNLTPSIEIKASNNQLVKLIHIEISDDEVRKIIPSERSIENASYAWINEKGEIFIIPKWDKLRQYDEVKIIYPASSGFKLAIIGKDIAREYYDYNLLKLKTNATYQFLLTVKGEDNEGNTVVSKKKVKKKVTEEEKTNSARALCKAKLFFRTERFFHEAGEKLSRKARHDNQHCLDIYPLKQEQPFRKL